MLVQPKQITEIENELPEAEDTIFKAADLNTGLKTTVGLKTVNNVSNNIEGFMTAVEKTLLKEAFRRKRFKHWNNKTK